MVKVQLRCAWRLDRRRAISPIVNIAAIFILGLTLSVAPVRAQETSKKLNEYLSALQRLHQFSGTVLVAKDGKPIFSRGYGMANLEWSVPNRPDTKFRVGSVTKQFTAMAIMMLQEQGKLDVQKPFCNYLEGCPESWSAITLQQLLTHTSGIPDFTGFPEYEKINKYPIEPSALVESFKNKPLEFAPGEKFAYSNSNYEILGFLIEKLSGQSYSAFLQQRIFEPLGMKDTGYDSNSMILPHRAAGYTRVGQAFVNANYIDIRVPYAAGGLYSTVQDLLRWDQALYTEKLVSRKSLTEMFTPHKATAGYGWAIETQFDHKMISHEGGIDGFVCKIARFPDDRVTIIALSNLESAPITNLSKDLAAIVFGEKYNLPRAHSFIHLETSKLNGYVGKYQVEAAPDIVIFVAVQGDKLAVHVQDQTILLMAESATKFSDEEGSATVEFAFDAEGKVGSLVFNGQFKAKKTE